MTKRLVALFLVLLLSIESFGAVVSDNDGSAFITKAEFDSLKNNFQSQIDQYNTSIDSKIDGAIAQYLAGISVQKKSTVVPFLRGKNLLVLNLDKYDKLKFGKMNFILNANVYNVTSEIAADWAANASRSSGVGFLSMERLDDNYGEGFEVFRVDKQNKMTYYDDLRFRFTANRTLAGRTSCGACERPNAIYARWHAGFRGKKQSSGEVDGDDGDTDGFGKYSDILSNPSWLSYWQSSGTGFICDSFIGRDNGYDFNSYSTSVSTVNKSTNNYILSTDATEGLSNSIFVCFTKDDWSTDLITQQDSLYAHYDTTTYKYALPTDAGLTVNKGCVWVINNWQYYYSGQNNYHWPGWAPTILATDIRWRDDGTYRDWSGEDTAGDFYEMIPKITNKDLNVLKNEQAMNKETNTLANWTGYLYQGLPLYNFEKPGTLTFEFDLTSAMEDLLFTIRPEPFTSDIRLSAYLNYDLSLPFNEFEVDGTQVNKSCVVLTAGRKHKISVGVNNRTMCYYKMVPQDSNSKKRTIIRIPSTMELALEG